MQTALLNDNIRHRKYTGVQKFHDAGYYGQRVTAASAESWSTSKYNPDGLVSEPLGAGIGADHAQLTAAVFFQVAPLAHLVQLPYTTYLYGTSSFKSGYISEVLPYIEKHNITNMFVSLVEDANPPLKDAIITNLRKLPYFKQWSAVGNDGKNKFNKILEIEEIFGVAGYRIMADMNINPASYSSITSTVDFAAPSSVYTNINATQPTDDGSPHEGTSIAAPWLCGMACLVDDFFIDKTGKPLTRENMYQFFKDNTIDLRDEGFDTKTGWGAVVLPDPKTIDIDKYRSPRTVDTFDDANEIGSWAKDSIERMIAYGIMNGTGKNMFTPKGTMTREQIATIMDRTIQYIKNELK